MRKNLLIIVLAVSLLATSCMTLAVKVMELDKKDAAVVTMTNNDRTVAFVPMKHIGPKEFYDDVKHIVDSLHAEGYVAYLESTRMTDSLTKEQLEVIHLKVRKMTGVYISKRGYLDTLNNRLMGRKFSNKMKLVNQPPYRKLGSDTLIDRIVDVPMNEIVLEYESRYSDVTLTDCDYSLPPEEKYDCGTEPRNQVNNVIMNYREHYLARTIMQDKNKKIAVIYGALHEKGLLRELKKIDTTWSYKK